MLAYLFVIAAVLLRLLPHPFSFTAVGASLLFFGANAPRKRAWIPVALLAASDLYLTLFHYDYVFSWDHFVTWGWYAGILMLGGWMRGRVTPGRVFGAALGTAVSFFVISNFAVWAALEMYPHNPPGLMAAYAAGVPFFRNELISDLLFAGIMFGSSALLQGAACAEVRRKAAA